MNCATKTALIEWVRRCGDERRGNAEAVEYVYMSGGVIDIAMVFEDMGCVVYCDTYFELGLPLYKQVKYWGLWTDRLVKAVAGLVVDIRIMWQIGIEQGKSTAPTEGDTKRRIERLVAELRRLQPTVNAGHNALMRKTIETECGLRGLPPLDYPYDLSVWYDGFEFNPCGTASPIKLPTYQFIY